MNLNPSPKDRLHASPDRLRAFHALIESPDFDYAIETALAQYSRDAAVFTPDEKSAAGHFKLKGAHEFVDTLRKLGEKQGVRIAPQVHNLDHEALRR